MQILFYAIKVIQLNAEYVSFLVSFNEEVI